MIIGNLDSVRTVAEIFSHFGGSNRNGFAMILLAKINRGYRKDLISNFNLILSIIIKGEPRVAQSALENPEIESITTISSDPEQRGLTWIVK